MKGIQFLIDLKQRMMKPVAGLKLGVDKLKSSVKSLNNTTIKPKVDSSGLDGFGKKLGSLKSMLTGALLGGAVLGAGSQILDTTAEMQSLRQAINVTSGSAQEGAANFKFIADTSDRLGLSLKSSTEGFKTLSGATMGTALAGQATRDIFEGVATGASALGISAENTEGALLALGQMMSKGKVSAEELNGQLGERIPGALGIAARAMGKTKAELLDMMQKGQIMSEDFLPKFAAEMKKTFQGAATDKLSNNLSRLSNDFLLIKERIGNALPLNNMLKLLRQGLQFFDELLTKSKALEPVFNSINDAIKPVYDSLVGLFDTLGLVGEQSAVIDNLVNRFGALMTFLTPMIQGVAEFSAEIVNIVKNLYNMIMNVEHVNKGIGAMVNIFRQAFVSIATIAKNTLGGVADLIIGIISADGSLIKSGFRKIGMAAVETAKAPISIIRSGIAGYGEGFMKNVDNLTADQQKKNFNDYWAKQDEQSLLDKASGTRTKPTTLNSLNKDRAKVSDGLNKVMGDAKASRNITINIGTIKAAEKIEAIIQNGKVNLSDIERQFTEVLLMAVRNSETTI